MASIWAAFQGQLECRDCLTDNFAVAAIDISKSNGDGKLHAQGSYFKTVWLSLIRKDFPAQLEISIRVRSPGQAFCCGWALFSLIYDCSVYAHFMRLYLESGWHIWLSVVNTPFIHDAEIGAF